ncbi:MAG: MAPEG family protein [Lysobacter sp.]
MTLATAYWCVLIAALLPYLWIAIAKGGGQRYDNRDPRGWMARQDNPRSVRANAAQLNAFEAFAPFAAGVILAQLAGVPVDRIALLALLFIVLRLLHGMFYLANVHALRSLVWFGGFACVLGLLVQAALRAGGAVAS